MMLSLTESNLKVTKNIESGTSSYTENDHISFLRSDLANKLRLENVDFEKIDISYYLQPLR
jgi:hypothetical protein